MNPQQMEFTRGNIREEQRHIDKIDVVAAKLQKTRGNHWVRMNRLKRELEVE